MSRICAGSSSAQGERVDAARREALQRELGRLLSIGCWLFAPARHPSDPAAGAAGACCAIINTVGSAEGCTTGDGALASRRPTFASWMNLITSWVGLAPSPNSRPRDGHAQEGGPRARRVPGVGRRGAHRHAGRGEEVETQDACDHQPQQHAGVDAENPPRRVVLEGRHEVRQADRRLVDGAVVAFAGRGRAVRGS